MSVPLKVVYLDLEGVVVTHRSILGASLRGLRYFSLEKERCIAGFDMSCVDLLLFMLNKHDAKLCITSTLRSNDDLKEWLLEIFKQRAPTLNLDLVFHDDWRTRHYSTREEEIEDHIARNNVTTWVSLDDRSLKLSNFVRCLPYDGFSLENFVNAEPFIADDPNNIKPELIFL